MVETDKEWVQATVALCQFLMKEHVDLFQLDELRYRFLARAKNEGVQVPLEDFLVIVGQILT